MKYLKLSVSVEAGLWDSRFFADNLSGQLVLCHTLKPNVSMDLSKKYGNAITLNAGGRFGETRYFEAYIQDPNEMVALSSYKVASEPKVSFLKEDLRRKFQIYYGWVSNKEFQMFDQGTI